MATTVTRHDMAVVGNRIADVFEFTLDGDTELSVPTRLRWVEFVSVIDLSGTDMSINASPNSKSQSLTDDTADAGYVFFGNLTDALTYKCVAYGW